MTGPVLFVGPPSPALAEVEAALAHARVETARALSGPHALLVAERARPSLVLTDWFIPGLDGLSLARALASRGIETLVVTDTAPAFPPGAEAPAQVLLEDPSWRAAVLERLGPAARASLRAWSRGEFEPQPAEPPARSEEPWPTLGASIEAVPTAMPSPSELRARLDAASTVTEAGEVLCAALAGAAPASAEAVLAALREAPRPEVRNAAFQVSALLLAPPGDRALVEAAAGAGALSFLLLGYSLRGPAGLPGLESIFAREDAPAVTRAKALELWRLRAEPREASARLRALVHDGADEIVRVALEGLRAGAPELLTALVEDATLSASAKAAALSVLGPAAPRPSLQAALEIATASEHAGVRAAAFEVGMRRLGARSGALLERLTLDGTEASGFAALAGVRGLGELGYGVLRAMAASRLPAAVLREVQRTLHSDFGVGEALSEDHDHLVEDLKEELVPTRPEAPAEFVGAERLVADFYTGPTEPRAPASEPRVPRRAASLTRSKSAAPAKTNSKPTAPAGTRSRGRSRAHAPAEPEGPSPRELRARLDAALAAGAAGRPVAVEIARNPRAPVDLRTRAIKLLGDELSGPEAFEALDALLFDEAPSVQNAALGVFMVAGAPRLDRFLAVALSPSVSAKVRARAVRHLGARFSREETAEALERLFEDASSMVRHAALEGLFPSLKNLEGQALEDGLLNLMNHHASTRVRVSAARALAAFGTGYALASLDRLSTSLFQATEVGEAARIAIVRLRARR